MRHVTMNNDIGNLAFGGGMRKCSGSNLAMAEIIAMLVILGREVSAFDISQEELQRPYFLLGHPTGMPLRLVPRARP
jgi:cytochrome P450